MGEERLIRLDGDRTASFAGIGQHVIYRVHENVDGTLVLIPVSDDVAEAQPQPVRHLALVSPARRAVTPS